jgi:hypothetical protein
MNASQNTGDDTPTSEMNRALWSTQLSRHTAATIPKGTPIAIDSTKAIVPSSTVAGADCAMSASTGRPVLIEIPRSP